MTNFQCVCESDNVKVKYASASLMMSFGKYRDDVHQMLFHL